MKTSFSRVVWLAAGALLLPAGFWNARGADPPSVAAEKAENKPLTPLEIASIHNALQWSAKIYSGSCPDDSEAGFKALAEKGIKTIITVDGAQPDAQTAQKYGLRYVHIPVEYSGIARADALKIIRAVRDLPGPVFIHCHHGIHRGPAAAALAAIALANFSNQKADDALQQAGTGANYKGLWRDVESFKRPTPAEIDAAPNDFPQRAPLGDLTAAMIAIDERFDGLKTVKKTAWKASAEHPDIDPAHEALLLREHFSEIQRLPKIQQFPADFLAELDKAQTNARELENALSGEKIEIAKADAAFEAVKADCGSCHQKYRDARTNHEK